MIANCTSVLSWLSGFFARLWRVAAFQALASVLVSLCSQILQIAAFLLPLKVMILLGSHGVPTYFPSVLAGVERERLILMLAAAAVVLYLAHLLMDFIGAILARKGSVRLIEPAREEALFAKQQKFALRFYLWFVIFASGCVFALGVLAFLGVFRPLILFVAVGYLITCFLVATLFFAWAPRLLASAASQFARIIDVLSACGFLLIFGFLVMDFLYGGAKELLLGILILLLCRQMFSRLSMALKSVERLYSNRDRFLILNAGVRPSMNYSDDEESLEEQSDDDLLQTRKRLGQSTEQLGIIDGDTSAVFIPEQSSLPIRPTYWQVIAPDNCRLWVTGALARAGVSSPLVSIEQWDEEQRGQLLLHLSCAQPQLPDRHFLFRAFNRKQTELAANTESLLAVYPGVSAPRILDVSEQHGFGAHLYEWVGDAYLVSDARGILACREQAFIESCAWSIPAKVLASRGGGTLVERCNSSLWARCQVFSRWLDMDTRQLVDDFVCKPQRLSKALSRLPLRLYNPDILAGRVYHTTEGYKVTWWGRWAVEPIGSGWPLELGYERLDQAFADACSNCEALLEFSPLQVRLAALAFAFEAQCSLGGYIRAFALLLQVRDALDALGQ